MNNAEFILSYFLARYCIGDFRYPATQACFEDIHREEGGPIYAVSGRICLNDVSYLAKLSIEQKTLKATVEVSAAKALTDAEADRFREQIPEINSALPLGFSVSLRDNRPVFTNLFHTEPTPCEEDEIYVELKFTLSVAVACYNRFRFDTPQKSDEMRRGSEQAEEQEEP